MTRRPTIHDVAARARVSAQTVSRVVNKSELVTAETRQRVLQAIEELDYQPNQAARSLNIQRSSVLLVISFHTDYPYAAWDMLGRARELGYQLMFITVDSASASDIRAAFASALKYVCEGIIFICPFLKIAVSQDEILKLCRNIPTVFVDAPLGSSLPSTVIDQRHGSRIATQHLIDLGHRSIVSVCGPIERLVDARERHQSWLETLHANNLVPGSWLEAGFGGFSLEGGYRAALSLLTGEYRFTALVAGNDNIAIGAMRALRERQVRVPEDISIVGFDDTDVGAYLPSPLTTVRQDFATMGRATIDYLISLIHNPDHKPPQLVHKPTLVVRASTQNLSHD